MPYRVGIVLWLLLLTAALSAAAPGGFSKKANREFFETLEKNRRNVLQPKRTFNQKTFWELNSSADGEDKATGEEQGDVNREGDEEKDKSRRIVAFKGLRGEISGEKGTQVRINFGASAGVEPGMQFAVYRDDTWIGLLEVLSVQEGASTCKGLAGPKEEARQEGWGFRAGDRVRQREDIVGAALAGEAEARKKLLELQRKEQKYLGELEGMAERETDLNHKLTAAASSKERLTAIKAVVELRKKFQGWLEGYGGWLLKVQEDKLAGNRHIAAYRETLQTQLEYEKNKNEWKGMEIDFITELMETYSEIEEKLEQKQKALNQEKARLDREAKSLNAVIEKLESGRVKSHRVASVNARINTFNKKQRAFNRDVDSYNEYVENLDAEIERRTAPTLRLLTLVREDYRTWNASDRIYAYKEKKENRSLIEASLNFAHYALSVGNDRKARRLFRRVRSLDGKKAYERESRDGMEHAMLKLILSGRSALEHTGLLPPFEESWSAQAGGRLQGGLRVEGGMVVGVFDAEKGRSVKSAATAWDVGSGERIWSFSFEGRLAGNKVFVGTQLFFSTSAGALFGLDARTGRVEHRWECHKECKRFEESTLVGTGEGIYWLAGFGEEGRHKNFIGYYLSLDEEGESFSFTGEGSLISCRLEGESLMFEVRREKEGWNHRSATAMPMNYLAGLDNPQIPATFTNGGKGVISWLKSFEDFTVVNVVDENAKNESKRISHVCFSGRGKGHEGDGNWGWKLSFEGRDAVADVFYEEGVAYILLRDGLLTALDVDNEKVLWTADVLIPSGRRFQYAEFLSTAGEELVVFGGSHYPPWAAYVIDKEAGIIGADYAITSDLAAPPHYRDGHLFLAVRDGSLRVVLPEKERTVWRFLVDEGESIYLPSRREEIREPVADDVRYATYADWQEGVYRAAYGGGMTERSDPLLIMKDRLVYYSERDSRIRAFRPLSKGTAP